MKYLDVLKEYDKAIVSESKRLDSIYKKLIGESCDCGKEDCPECGKKKELDEGCDKGKIEFDEGDAEGGKQDKKMMPPEEFNKMVSKEEFLGKGKDSEDNTEECNEDDPLNGGLHNGHKKVSEGEDENKGEPPPAEEPEKKEDEPVDGKKEDNGNVDEDKNIEKEIEDFFGISKNDKEEDLKEDAAKNQQMDASEIFAEADGDDEKKEESSAEEPEKKEEPPAEEPEKKEEPAKKEEPPAEEPEKKVDENDGKSIKELMCKKDEVAEGEKLSMKEIMAKESSCNEDDPLNGGIHNGHQVEEEVDDETKSLNESIQAIRKFVKANKKYFK